MVKMPIGCFCISIVFLWSVVAATASSTLLTLGCCHWCAAGCRDVTEEFPYAALGSWTLTHAVWLHGDGVGDVREDTDGVASVQPVDESVALEEEAVDVCLCAQSRQVPRYSVPLAHRQAREVPVHVPIDGCSTDTQTEKVKKKKKKRYVKYFPLKKKAKHFSFS